MSLPIVSIIIPTYNCARYIAETLGSVTHQTMTDWEVIVVDDGSTDETLSIASNFDARIRIVKQANAGVCVARNNGFHASRGKFLCFLDHDDYWFPEKLERQLGWMNRRPEFGVVYTNCINWHPVDGHFPLPQSMRSDDEADVLDEAFTGWVYHRFMLDSCALTSSAMIRREALETCGLFDVGLPYSEDWDLFLRLSRRYQFAQMRWRSTLYRQHAKQGSRIARPIDYRTELLLRANRQWGLTGPDGSEVDSRQFAELLARFRMEFGRQHLMAGNRRQGVIALLDAWRRSPARLRYLAQAMAGAAGWKPAD